MALSTLVHWFMPSVALATTRFSLNGYNSIYAMGFSYPEYTDALASLSDVIVGSFTNRLRLNARYTPNTLVSIHAAVDCSVRAQHSLLFNGSSSTTNGSDTFPEYRISDPARKLIPDRDHQVDNAELFWNLDRLYGVAGLAHADIYIGRQAISWGSGHIINPIDVLIPYRFNEFDTDERIGVDALRIRIPTGRLSELDFGFVAGDNACADTSAWYCRAKHHYFSFDQSWMLMRFLTHGLIGIDLTGAIMDAGCWIESAWVMTDLFDWSERSASHDYIRTTCGLDYACTDELYTFVEFHYNQAGQIHPRDYDENALRPAYRDGAVYLNGQYYLGSGMTYQHTPLIASTGYVLVNCTDGSFFAVPEMEYNVFENTYLHAGLYVGVGKSPTSDSGILTYHSEFGAYVDMCFISGRFYF
ncbi:MAG: hypothetical protein GF397_05525 [Elusimicrobia bacterium]|nr:hypothetical protein [Elusimicrobiota bacterium]